ncbi:hypothetical protein MFUL124B02_19740 [Myxococcus fulvus 124B02]|nr:hypothetical protein MFUL124B02_19740 [Myxococcus fulvus 124B02]
MNNKVQVMRLSQFLPGGRGWLLGSLVALAVGCQGADTQEEEVDQDTFSLEQALGPLRERSCEELKLARPSAEDGEYTLYIFGDPAMPWTAWCHDMAGTPAEYLPLREVGLSANYSQYTAGGASPGTSVRTAYQRLRINPFTLEVDTSDRTFASSTGELRHSGGASVTAMPYATAMSCDYGDTGRARIDLRGTPFKVAPEYFQVLGWGQHGAQVYGFADQLVTVTGGGYCGWNAPLLADPFAGGFLPLLYTVANQAWTPTVRVYPFGGAEAQVQTFHVGTYEHGQLHVGAQGIGALHVPRGWVVTLYAQDDFGGTATRYTSDTELTATAPERWARSLRVEAPVRVFAGAGQTGTTQSLRAGRYDLDTLTVGNDAIRSVQVPDGYRVTLHADSGFSGPRLHLTEDTDLSGLELNARTSSLVVESTTVRDSNSVDGFWRGSGGQNPDSTANRTFFVDHTGPAELVTFTLSSVVGSYLYLFDAQGHRLAEAAYASNSPDATLSALLTPGTYRLVAATQEAGQTGYFTLRADRARLRAPQRLTVKAVHTFSWVYDDDGTGANDSVTVWRPSTAGSPGFYPLGDLAQPNEGGPAPKTTFLVSGEGDVLARPVDYDLIWDDRGSGGTDDVRFWHPRPPAGYTCLGSVAQLDDDKPSLDLVRCVKSEYVVPARASWVWNDRGSGADDDITVWQADAREHLGLNLSVIVAQGHYGDPEGHRFWTLNKSMLANTELQGGVVDDLLVRRFAPRIWLHPEEQFWPTSTQTFVSNMSQTATRLTTPTGLGCDSCAPFAFLAGQNPSQADVPVYAQVIPRTQSDRPTNVTDVVYWVFYGYNRGKRACKHEANASRPRSCDEWDSFANHVGDWEHLTVRFVDGRPAVLTTSQGVLLAPMSFGDKNVALVGGWRPELYAAKGSHGLYPEVATYDYGWRGLWSEFRDVTGRGTAWDTWRDLRISPWQRRGGYSGNGFEGFNLTLAWGNERSGCDNDGADATGHCVLDPGPLGPAMRAFAQPASLDMR